MLRKITSNNNSIIFKTTVEPNLQLSKYHGNNKIQAKIITNWDNCTKSKIQSAGNNSNINIKKSMSFKHKKCVIEYYKKNTDNIKQQIINHNIEYSYKDIYDLSVDTYEQALNHYCIHDIIKQNKDDTVTIAFLPISTSKNPILCGIQEFDKMFIYSNGIKNFYITRVLFYKTMTKADYNDWIHNTQYQYKGDLNARKIIFNEIQNDLDKNEYSLLKDEDLYKFNLEFFTKELPRVKFKFTDLVE